MPSLVTSSSLNPSARGLSRVNSIQRKWDDDEPSSSSSRGAIEWSPSPERVKRRPVVSSSAAKEGETPQERRRRAILESMSQNTSSSLSTAAGSSSSSRHTGRTAALPLVPAQSLPSLPSLKRTQPWDQDFTTAKKVMDSKSISSRSNSSTSSNGKGKKTSIGPTISIKQKLVLSGEQQKVLQLVVEEGKNIFFTGSAGTGKSVLLREIITALRRKYFKSPDAVAVTASTGIAACNIGGVTLHSFGGVGLAFEEADKLVGKIKMNKKAASRWTRTKVLIIDEVSMVDAELFDKFNKIGKMMRKKMSEPFGGIQVIVTGDFFQLPPVTKGNSEPKFCFEAQTWNETIPLSVNLTKVFRQRDERFVTMLNEMRFGKLSNASIAAFKQLSRTITYDDGIAATELFPRREDVDRANSMRLTSLSTDGWSYEALDGGSVTDRAQREKMLSNFMAPALIFLKVDAQVMLIKNVDETLVNGSMGKVVGFCHKVEFVMDSNGRWREGGIFEDDEMDEKKQKLLDNLRSKVSSSARPYPVVRFKVPGGVRDMLVEPDTFKTELPTGEIQVSRVQVPLILAWAMSIHKAQGQTLDRVKVDLNKVFEKGQAYVALSRATSLEGLEVQGFRADKVMVHRKVAQWTATLQSLSD